MTVKQIIWCVTIGIAIAAVYTFYNKKVLGGLVKKLFDMDAFDIDSAVDLGSAGYSKNIFIKYSLREGTSFADTVRCHDGRYYIPEEKIHKAENKYKDEGATIVVLLITLAVLFIVALIAVYAFPNLINQITNNLFS